MDEGRKRIITWRAWSQSGSAVRTCQMTEPLGLKIRNPNYTQIIGRDKMFEKRGGIRREPRVFALVAPQREALGSDARILVLPNEI